MSGNNGILLRPLYRAMFAGSGGGSNSAIVFGDESPVAMGGILTNDVRINLTTAERGIDGFTFDLMIPTGVESSFAIISDNATSAVPVYHRVIGGQSQFLISSTVVISGINLADSKWHHIEVIKNSNNFNYYVTVDGVKYTTGTSSSSTRHFDSIGVGNGSVVAPNNGVMIRNFQGIFNKQVLFDYPMSEGSGNPINAVNGTESTLENATIGWRNSPRISIVPNEILMRDGSNFDLIYYAAGFNLMSTSGSYLELEYHVRTPGTYNNLLTLDGLSSNNSNWIYVRSLYPSRLYLVTSSGTSRYLDTGVDLLNGSHKIKFSYTSGLNLDVTIDDVAVGAIGNSALSTMYAIGGRSVQNNGAGDWTVKSIKYHDGTNLLVDCPALDGMGRILRNHVEGQDDLVIGSETYPWTEYPVPVDDIPDVPDIPDPPEPEPDVPPELISSPQSSTESVGFFHTLTAQFSGSNLTYQWFENGEAMEGETSDTLELLLNASMNNNSYFCRAMNTLNQVDSGAAKLTLRPRIYMNWDITVPEIDTTDKIYLTFRDDGSISYYTDLEQFNEDWCSSARDGRLNFNMHDYEVKLNTLSGNEAVVDPTSGITSEYVEMYSGITLILDVSAVPAGESRNFNVIVQDKVMPGYNWAGWDNDTLFYRRQA